MSQGVVVNTCLPKTAWPPTYDDAIRAVKLIAAEMANAVLEGKQGEQVAAEATEEAAE